MVNRFFQPEVQLSKANTLDTEAPSHLFEISSLFF